MLRYDTAAARLRTIAFLEGISYLLLLFIAMPLKYLAGMPMAVRIVGSLHGVLFVWLFLLIAQGYFRRQKDFAWSFRIAIASLIPFAMFFIDARLRLEEEQERESNHGTAS